MWWLESQLPRSGFKSVEIRRVAFDHGLVDGLRQVVNTAGVNLDFVIIMQLTYPYVTELGPRWDYLLGQWVMLEVTTRIRVYPTAHSRDTRAFSFMTVLALLRALAVPLFAEVVSFDVGMTVDCCHFGNDIAT